MLVHSSGLGRMSTDASLPDTVHLLQPMYCVLGPTDPSSKFTNRLRFATLPSLLQLDQGSDEAIEVLHRGWLVLLDHMAVAGPYSTLNQQLVCILSLVSRGMRSTVMAQAAGHVSVEVNNRRIGAQKTLNSFARYAVQRRCRAMIFIVSRFVRGALFSPNVL